MSKRLSKTMESASCCWCVMSSKHVLKGIIIIAIVCAISWCVFTVRNVSRILDCEKIATFYDPIRIDYCYQNGSFYIPVPVNGDTVQMILDNHCQSVMRVDRLGIIGRPIGSIAIKAKNLRGRKHNNDYFLVDSVGFGNHFSNVLFKSVSPGDHLWGSIEEGIIGNNFICSFSWMFDDSSHTVEVSSSGVSNNIQNYQLIDRGLSINGISVSFSDNIQSKFTLDMGCGDVMLIDKHLFNRLSDILQYDMYHYLTAENTTVSAAVFENVTFHIMGEEYNSRRVLYEEGVNKNILGAPFLEGRNFILDFPTNRLFVGDRGVLGNKEDTCLVDENGIKYGIRNGKEVVIVIKMGSKADIDGVKLGDVKR